MMRDQLKQNVMVGRYVRLRATGQQGQIVEVLTRSPDPLLMIQLDKGALITATRTEIDLVGKVLQKGIA